jgi:hypothetical protein
MVHQRTSVLITEAHRSTNVLKPEGRVWKPGPDSWLTGAVVQAHLRIQNEPRAKIGLLFVRSGCICWVEKVFLFIYLQPARNLDGDEIRHMPKVTYSLQRVALPCSHLPSHINHNS